jgi:hypothetical protein
MLEAIKFAPLAKGLVLIIIGFILLTIGGEIAKWIVRFFGVVLIILGFLTLI